MQMFSGNFPHGHQHTLQLLPGFPHSLEVLSPLASIRNERHALGAPPAQGAAAQAPAPLQLRVLDGAGMPATLVEPKGRSKLPLCLPTARLCLLHTSLGAGASVQLQESQFRSGE